jgi:hypothetical protein
VASIPKKYSATALLSTSGSKRCAARRCDTYESVTTAGRIDPAGPYPELAVKRVEMRTAVILQLCVAVAIARAHDPKINSIPDTRHLVWAIQIAKVLKEPLGRAGNERYETEGLSFSPDGKQLAVVVNRTLLIVDSQSPETNVRQFDLAGTCGIDLTWNERGDALLVCGTLLRLADGASCDATGLPPFAREFSSINAFWLDSAHVVRSNTGEILDLACKLVGMWQLAPTWQISAVAASKGWILLWHTEGPREKVIYQYSLADRASHQSLSGWPMRKVPSPSGGAMLAVGAEALCFSLHEQNDFENGKLRCREIHGGTEIPILKQLQAYKLTEAASSSARVVAEKWEQYHLPWWEFWVPIPGYPALPVRRVVFDLRSGNLIASWKPRIQDSRRPNHPYHCALSASGEYLAESGDGSVELYRLAP